MLQTAIEATHRAGRVIAKRYPETRDVSVKGYRDIVTATDREAEDAILNVIQERFPDHAILSEEAGEVGSESEYTWVVDPLDGTSNYAHRIPVFSVSIGVLSQGTPMIGVIHDPLRQQTFVAERDGGARLNGAPMQTSSVTEMSHALIGLDWGHQDVVRAQVLAALQRIAPHCGTVRGLGSAALALAYVAAGWMDTYFNLGLKPWDTAAGQLLVEEAGGRCTTLDGALYRIDAADCLASNGLFHESLLSMLSPRQHD
ncbi:MAG TPA: inositol monophosphatase [Chloroflexi bacterium]|nr:inositol monophosphatase [Chloroflexota bacterium]